MKPVVSLKKYHAFIFDLDGVITKTANIHAMAWKKLFDAYLKKKAAEKGEVFTPFDSKKDYLEYVDGKPRMEGIRSFLKSRGFDQPLGNPDDNEEQETLYGLGNKKNQMFLEALEKEGVEYYQTSIQFIEKLRSYTIKTALISSSKNCSTILEKLKISELFDAKIDGLDANKMQIVGKPEPDIFLKAAERLGVDTANTVIVEDAISGVQAGKKGNFGLVIGVDRANQAAKLLENGADFVVKDLAEIILQNDSPVPNACSHFNEFQNLLGKKQLAIFLDYDGTLTPIVSHPEKAILDDEMKKILKRLSKKFTIAIISGRDRKDVEQKVALQGIFYAGSHGFDIAGPRGQHFENEKAKEKLKHLRDAEKKIKKELNSIDGAWVESKKYSIAIHFRQVAKEKESAVEQIVKNVEKQFAGDLRLTTGKKIFEFQPAIHWHKGKALKWLMNQLGLHKEKVVPLYIGDDVTDEDAFEELGDEGIGISVQEEPKQTLAHFTLKSPEQVKDFFNVLLDQSA